MKNKLYQISLLKTKYTKELTIKELGFKSFILFDEKKIANLLDDEWQAMTILNYNFKEGFERYYFLYNPNDYKPFIEKYGKENLNIRELAMPWCLMGAFKKLGKPAEDFQKLSQIDYYKNIYYIDGFIAPFYKEGNEIVPDEKLIFEGQATRPALNEVN